MAQTYSTQVYSQVHHVGSKDDVTCDTTCNYVCPGIFVAGQCDGVCLQYFWYSKYKRGTAYIHQHPTVDTLGPTLIPLSGRSYDSYTSKRPFCVKSHARQ